MWMKLGTVLVREGVITPAQFDEALRVQLARGGRLGSILVELGSLDINVLGEWLSRVCGCPCATDAMMEEAPAEVLQLIPATMAERFECFPLRLEERALAVAFVTPSEPAALDALGARTRLRIIPYVVPEPRLLRFLEKRYGLIRRASAPPPPRAMISGIDPVQPRRSQPPPDRLSQPPRLSPHPLLSRPAAPRPTRPPPPSVEHTAKLLDEAQSRDDVVDILLRHAAGALDAALLLIVRHDTIFGWQGRGEGFEAAAATAVELPLNAPSLFQEANDRRRATGGIVVSSPVHKRFYQLLKHEPPASAIVIPIAVRTRVVNFLYAERRSRFDAMDAAPALEELGRHAGNAYARILAEAHRRAV